MSSRPEDPTMYITCHAQYSYVTCLYKYLLWKLLVTPAKAEHITSFVYFTFMRLITPVGFVICCSILYIARMQANHLDIVFKDITYI